MPELFNQELLNAGTKYTFGQVQYLYAGATPANNTLPSYAFYKKYIRKGDVWVAANENEFLYWRPYMPEDTRFILLNNEYPQVIEDLRLKTKLYAGEKAATANIPPSLASPSPEGQRYAWPVGGNGALYIATGTTVDFAVLRWNFPNPYNTSSIRVWIKSGDQYANTLETGTTYWYNPITKSFLPIPILVSSVGTTQSAYQLSIREGKILAAIASGLSRESAISKVDSVTSIIVKAKSTSTNTNTNANANNQKQNGAITRVKIRGNFGYLGIGDREGSSSQMVQMYSLPEDITPRTARHIFNISPGQISYSNLGSDWQEIERVGQIGLVDWKSYKLMKISFQFLIIPDKSETYDRAGGFSDDATNTKITVGVDGQIRNLRAMATRPYPVVLYGFDDMMTNQLRFPSDKGRGVEFVVGDLNISSIYRTESGEINRATCDITLQELPLEAIRIIEMPKLIPEKLRTKPKKEEEEFGKRRLLTDDSNATTLSKNVDTVG